MVIPDRPGDAPRCGPTAEQDLVKGAAELKALTRRLAAETAERRRLERELQSLPSQIMAAQDTERRRIARELHDGVNQLLASAKFRLMHVESQLTGTEGETAKQARELLEKAVAEVRRISNNLRPTELDDFGLVAAVERLSQELQQRSKIQVELNRNMPSKRFPRDVELAFYRIVQEALANVEEHSGASAVILTLIGDEDFATLNIRDDGRGISKTKAPSRDRGLGIVSMRERANALGGVFSVNSKTGRGTEISVHVKLRD